MKCVYCGAWTTVRETRGAIRVRVCGNDHKFKTEERAIKEFDAKHKLMADEVVVNGKTMTQVAKEFGLKSHSEVSRAVHAYYPKFNARTQGQLVYWAGKRKAPKLPG